MRRVRTQPHLSRFNTPSFVGKVEMCFTYFDSMKTCDFQWKLQTWAVGFHCRSTERQNQMDVFDLAKKVETEEAALVFGYGLGLVRRTAPECPSCGQTMKWERGIKRGALTVFGAVGTEPTQELRGRCSTGRYSTNSIFPSRCFEARVLHRTTYVRERRCRERENVPKDRRQNPQDSPHDDESVQRSKQEAHWSMVFSEHKY